MATSPDVIKNKRPQLLAMVRCWTKAMDIVRDNPREAGALVRRYFPDMDDAVYNAAFEKYRKGVPTSPMVVPDQLEKLVKFMHISKGTPISAKLADVFHPDIAEEVIKATGRRS
jgi:ABC-type nitrate/sulfonate/bicarbonate transport system substrate-binding protein